MRAALALLLLVLLPSHAAVPAALQRGAGPEPDSLDPHRAQGLSAQAIVRDLYEGLTEEGPDGRAVAAAAESWTMAPDGRQYRFRLRRDGRWSDGRPLVAQDFVFALRRALAPSTAAPYAAVLHPIQGAAELLRGQAAPEQLGVIAVDEYTLVIQLRAPSLDLPLRLSLPVAFPVRLEVAGAAPERAFRAGTLVGNGPYRLVSWRPQSHLELSANPYYRRPPPIATVRYHVTEDAGIEAKRFLAGELHLTQTTPPGRLSDLRARFGDALQVGPAHGTFFLGYNLTRPPFQGSPELRAALSLAVDREILVRHVTAMGERPAWRLIPPTLDPDPGPAAHLDADARLARARALYAQAGYGPERVLEVELRYNSSALHRRTAVAVAAMWRQALGVRTRLRAEEWKAFVQTRRAKLLTQVFRGGWSADYGDPLNFLEPFRSQAPINYLGWADPDYDAALDRAAIALDPAERTAAWRSAEARLLAAHALLPLYHYTSKALVDPRLGGYRPDPLDRQPSARLYWRSEP